MCLELFIKRATDLSDKFHITTWSFSDRASWISYILITNLMHRLLFIHKILFSCTCFDPQVLIFRRIQLYTCSIWYCHSLREFVVACRYTAWVRVSEFSLKLCTDRPPWALVESDSTICCMYTIYPPEDEHLWLETCRGIIFYK